MPDKLFDGRRLRHLAARARTLALFYLISLFVATHIPLPDGSLSNSDKLIHFGAYTLLTLWVMAGWELTVGVMEAKHYFAVWLVGTLYGAVDELTQIPVNRHFDMNDWMADVLGIVAGLVVFRIVRRPMYWVLAGGKSWSWNKP